MYNLLNFQQTDNGNDQNYWFNIEKETISNKNQEKKEFM